MKTENAMTASRKFLRTTLAAAAFIMAASDLFPAALAQMPPAPAPMGSGPSRHGAAFSPMDENKDGVVTKDEFVKYRSEEFKRLDTNKDGTISKVEYMTPPRGGHMSETAQIAREMKFKQINTSGSGSISKAEWDTETDALFTRYDRNGDGKLTADELGPPGRKGGAP
jgi:EF hand